MTRKARRAALDKFLHRYRDAPLYEHLGSCTVCRGLGVVISRRAFSLCRCVTRAAARSCLRYVRRMDLHFNWVRFSRNAEYAADVRLAVERALTADEARLIVDFHVLRRSWKNAGSHRYDHGSFFHELYRIEEKLGRAILATRHYSIYPVHRYFDGVLHEGPTFCVEKPDDDVNSRSTLWARIGKNPD